MIFEPRTRTLIREGTGGGLPSFYPISGTKAAPVLGAAKTLDKLPPTFSPIAIAVREYGAKCP